MPTTVSSPPPAIVPDRDARGAIQEALGRIAPLWPLKHFVAVNPFLGLLDRPFAEACELLQRTAGAAPVQTPAEYRAAFERGEITTADLAAVADETWTVERLLAVLDDPDTARETLSPVLTVAEELDADLPHAHWSRFVVDEISKWCGVYFDENQTTWQAPGRAEGLFAMWRAAAAIDHNPEAFGLKGFRAHVAALPTDPDAVIAAGLAQIAPPGVAWADFLHRQLLSIAGWAGYAQYLAREDALRGKTNCLLRDLLAVRLVYDTALHAAFGAEPNFRANWHRAHPHPRSSPSLAALVRWQAAYETGYQRQLAAQLTQGTTPEPSRPASARPDFQAIFCIDVRSEVLRRHVEAAAPNAQTLGFAGFFGFPVAHRRGIETAATARCPVLLVPPVESDDAMTPAEIPATRAKLAAAGAWKAFQNSAISCFSFVEAVGLAFAPALARHQAKTRHACARVAPRITTDLPLERRVDLAEGALRNMSLTRNFARLVLVCGHGSTSTNNPYASGLDCGACGGHAGDVNARLAAATFNDPDVRHGLAARGIEIPADTRFLAGLHHTTTDEVTLFDDPNLPATHGADLAQLRTALEQAGAACRAERAAALGLDAATTADANTLLASLRHRAQDAAQVRPEWGLANNAAIVAAPRRRTSGLNLGGRVFLHDYNPAEDPEDKVLTLILNAPVVVASWINLQYYASRVDPDRYGAGDKTLHNIVGGLGALEGNSGDLRVGLPLQSIHDGHRFRHEPRRLSVFIEAAPGRIERVLQRHPDVERLFRHGWIHLFALQGSTVWQRHGTSWFDALAHEPAARPSA